MTGAGGRTRRHAAVVLTVAVLLTAAAPGWAAGEPDPAPAALPTFGPHPSNWTPWPDPDRLIHGL
jgi:hypothetical protein